MSNIIYSKFSNERADKFKIRTDILIDDKGKKIVRKKPLTQEANIHIDSIYNSYNLLSEMYRDSNLEINKCYRTNDGIEIEYISGNTLEEELDKLLIKKKLYKNMLRKNSSLFVEVTSLIVVRNLSIN